MFKLISRFHLLQGLVLLAITGVAVFRIPADFVFVVHRVSRGDDWLWSRNGTLAGGVICALILLTGFAGLGLWLSKSQRARTHHILDPALTLCLAIILAVQLGWLLIGTASDLDLIRLTGFGLGATLLVLAIVLAEAERNTYAGLRLPWPIADDAAWRIVHRIAGIAFGLAGAGVLALAWLRPDPGPLVIAFALALVAPVIAAALATIMAR